MTRISARKFYISTLFCLCLALTPGISFAFSPDEVEFIIPAGTLSATTLSSSVKVSPSSGDYKQPGQIYVLASVPGFGNFAKNASGEWVPFDANSTPAIGVPIVPSFLQNVTLTNFSVPILSGFDFSKSRFLDNAKIYVGYGVGNTLGGARDFMGGKYKMVCNITRIGSSISCGNPYDTTSIGSVTGGINPIFLRSFPNYPISAAQLPPNATDSSVEGTDTYGVGVRDDVQNLIYSQTGTDRKLWGAATQVALAMQDLVKAGNALSTQSSTGGNTNENAFYGNLDIDRGLGCLKKRFGAENADIVFSLLAQATFNTPDRFLAYLRAYKAVLGVPIPDANAATSCADGLDNTLSATTGCSTGTRETKVLFINGINNTPTEIGASRNKLDAILGPIATAEGYKLTVDKIENPSNGLLADLLESAIQRITNPNEKVPVVVYLVAWSGGKIPKLLSAIALYAIANEYSSVPAIKDIVSIFPQSLLNVLSKLDREKFPLITSMFVSEQAGLALPGGPECVKQLANTTSSLLLEKTPTIWVAHSQGNFFTNQAYTTLTAKGTNPTGLSIINIGDPATYQAGAEKIPVYLYSNTRDPVPYLGQLTPNVTIEGCFPLVSYLTDSNADPLCHGLDKVYTGPLKIQGTSQTAQEYFTDVYKKAFTEAKKSVTQTSTNNGDVTITLTWDSLGDVDLHVIEPDKTHVYYGSKTGHSGIQDWDNIRGYGPEHYYSNCSLAEGEYLVGVNYFSGSAPVNATVTISAKGPRPATRSFNISLSQAKGIWGDSTPQLLARVLVQKTPYGMQYSIADYK